VTLEADQTYCDVVDSQAEELLRHRAAVTLPGDAAPIVSSNSRQHRLPEPPRAPS
jgi:hypothetical protein